MEKLISVIVPIYKTEKYLAECIESILKQTYRNLEIILVDDGSPDGCAVICDRYAEQDSRIRVIHKTNGGLSSARNAGIDIATGEYLSFIDSDDSIHETFIEVLYGLCENNQCDVAQCNYLCVAENSLKLGPQNQETVSLYDQPEIREMLCDWPCKINYSVWNKLYKTELFKTLRFPIGKICEDLFVSHLLFWDASRIGISNLYLYWYLQRSDSIMGSQFSVARLDNILAYRNRAEFFRQKRMMRGYENYIIACYTNS